MANAAPNIVAPTPGELDDTLVRLSRRFKAADVEKRSGFHYLKIDSVINRFNEVCGLGFDFKIESLVVSVPDEKTSSGKSQYRVDAFGNITVHTAFNKATRSGSGAAINFDVDNAVKTAQAEVFKKAGHQFGVGLYLWKEDERALVDAVNAAEAADDLGAYKAAVALLASIEGVSPINAETLADHFGLASTADLQNTDTLRGILTNAGLI